MNSALSEVLIDSSKNSTEVKETILVVEDDEGLRRLINKNLSRAGFQTEFASCGAETISKINENPKVILLLDYGLPDMKANQVIEKLQEMGHIVPFIIMTGQGDERIAVEMMKLGARDYIVKDANFMDLLPQMISRVLERLATERKLDETEAILRDKERSISTLMGNLPGMAYRCKNDKNRTMTFVSDGCIKLTGFKPHDLVAENVTTYMKLIHADDQDMVLDKIHSALDKKRPFQITYRIHTASDEEKWVLEKGIGIFSPDVGLEGLEGFISDITDRKRAEQELQLAEERYRTIFQNSAVAITVTDENENIVSWNKYAEALLGMDKDDLYLKPVKSLFPSEEWERIRAQNVRQKGVQYQFETKIINKKQDVIDVSISLSVFKNHKGEVTGSIGIMSDITDRKRSEKALLTYKERLENLVEESPVAMISTDPAGNIDTMNKSAKKLLETEEFENKSIASIMGEEIEIKGQDDHRLTFTKRNGSEIPLSLSTAVLEEGGEKKGLIITLRDLSELAGLRIKPVEENRVETKMIFQLDKGDIYLIDDETTELGFKIFVDLVKHAKPGLCISRQNPIKIKKRYNLEKTPVVWLTRNEVEDVTCIHPNDLITKLQSTLINFIKEADDGVILLDGIEYLTAQNDFISVLKFIQAINDDLMASRSRLIVLMDSKAFDQREFHSLRKEMISYHFDG